MADVEYTPAQIETKWQQYWEDSALFRAADNDAREPFYLLMMFPYPSGTLHMGHVINYTIGDIVARYQLMCGRNVMHPIGWDALGLPAENAAIRTGTPPQQFTRRNIDKMRAQMKAAGWGFDWARECSTAHPDYYKWTQWLFLQFFNHGLATRKPGTVNWCERCQTVLANEQVSDGACERCGEVVDKRDMVQWYFKMSQYAQRLLDDHAKIRDGWPERVLKMQENWIGRSEGARVDFTLVAPGCKLDQTPLSVFTTRPDTLWGVTFMSLAPEHPLVAELVAGTAGEAAVMAAVKRMRNQSAIQRTDESSLKEGIFTGRYVRNPVNGEEVPLWVANFALMDYGTGAVMSVPAHDRRDFAFAQTYGLPIRVVIQNQSQSLDAATMTDAYVDNGGMVNSGAFDGRNNREAMHDIIEYLGAHGYGAGTVNYRLRDWLISRQRYWGVPIPIIHCPDCGMVPVPAAELPVRLPENIDMKPKGKSPLAACEAFVNTTCPSCGGAARRETDTMDTFVDSSWYFLRYCSPRHDAAAWDPQAVQKWMSVDQYVGGIEHATMHLIYARFFMKVLYDLGLVSIDEPFARLFCQGMVCMDAYRCPEHGWVAVADVDTATRTHRDCGASVSCEMSKMSKTKLNTASPDEVLRDYGADTMHLAIVSDTPPDQDNIYSEENVRGAHRFIRSLYELACNRLATIGGVAPYNGDGSDLAEIDKDLRRSAHTAIEKITRSMQFRFNTAIAEIRVLTTAIRKAEGARPDVIREALGILLQLAAPFIPHVCEELWRAAGNSDSIFRSRWPTVDTTALVTDTIEVPVQINGKRRALLQVPATADSQALEAAALADATVQRYVADQVIHKIIVVGGGKLVNIVVK